jgi:predicted dienelactone hydrolase
VISPTHSDSFSLRNSPQDPFDIRVLQNRRDNEDRLAEDRVADLKLLLDMFPALKGMMPDFRGDLDRDSIGVAGHSLGAHTAQLIAGAEIARGRRSSAQLGDSRIKAALLLSAPGRGQMGLNEKSWEKVQIPLLVMTGSGDFSGRGQGSFSRLDPFQLSAQKQKYGVYIEGANHFSFVGNPEIARRVGAWAGLRRRDPEAVVPDQKAIIDWVKIACIAFWDSSLKKSEKALKYLDSDELPSFSQGKLKLTRR